MEFITTVSIVLFFFALLLGSVGGMANALTDLLFYWIDVKEENKSE